MKQEILTKKIFIWNIVGCVINSAASFILLAFVTRTVTTAEAGYFSVAFATAQLLLAFGKYGVRAYQATDVNCSISFQAFVLNRIITSIGMMIASVIYVILSGYSIYKATVVICVCSIKVVDAIEDVFHGELQLIGKLDVAGKLLTVRNLFTIFCFGVLMFQTHKLIITCSTTAILSLVVCLLLNVYAIIKAKGRSQNCQLQQIFTVFTQCFPLFIGSFLSILVYNMPKYAIDYFAMEEIQTAYNIIFMPAFGINMVSEFIFKPLLTPLAHFWTERKIYEIRMIIIKLFFAVVGITIIILIGGYICGIPLLEFIYGISLLNYRKELLLLLAGGGFSAAVYLSYNLLTMMRVQKLVFPGYVGGALLAMIIAWTFVQKSGITGAALTYLCVEFLMCAYFIFAIENTLRKSKNKSK